MFPSFEDLLRVAVVGFGATAVMDVWLWMLARAKVPTLDFALVGRWVGHALRGTWRHAAIARAPAVAGERALGWFTHYAVGVGFAFVLAAVAGFDWTHAPRFLPALAVGIASVAAPWFVMQPAMGAGFASSKTPAPAKNRARALANHAVFGAGLYVAGWLVARVAA